MTRIPASQYRKETRRIFKRAVLFRLRRLGFWSLFKRLKAHEQKIVYIDAGLHKKALEFNLVGSWYSRFPNFEFFGFEAHPAYYAEACRNSPSNSKAFQMVNVALVGPNDKPSINLYLDGREGLGDSILRKGSEHFITVPAIRLSEFLKKNGINPIKDVIILRMNIEGAEVLVLKDLQDSGMLRFVDGFFGSWDDIRKIGGELLQDYRAIVRKSKIQHLGFNNRDLRSAVRRFSIRYQMETCMMIGIKRKALP